MNGKYYDIFFDPAELEVDRVGNLENPDALQIIEFEYDEDTDEVTACRRVDQKGNVIEDPWKDLQYSDDMAHVGEGDDETIREAMIRFEGWLKEHTAWVESTPETRWQPASYVCVGIIGYTD